MRYGNIQVETLDECGVKKGIYNLFVYMSVQEGIQKGCFQDYHRVPLRNFHWPGL